MVKKIFDNCGESLKKYAIILFYILILIGVLLIVIGLIPILDNLEYTSLSEVISMTPDRYLYGLARDYSFITEPYEGFQNIKFGFIVLLSSISTLPLYAFGTLVENIQNISNTVQKIDSKIISNDKYHVARNEMKSNYTTEVNNFEDLPKL